jgi:hypothetical protein
MPWSTTIPSDDVVGIHAALVPTANGDGEILLFGGDNHDHAAAQSNQFDHAQRFNCRHPNQALLYVHSPSYDLFCAGHGFLGDGRLMVAGGTAEFPAEAGGIHHDIHFGGHRHSSIYNPPTGAFVAASDMGPEPGHTTGGGRWYPTVCTLATGEVLAFQGHPVEDDHRHGNNTPERYQPLADRWVMLPAVGNVAGDPILYPRLHVLRDGLVFVSSRIPDFPKNISLNPWSGAVGQVCDLPDGAYHGFNCPSVLLPLVPADNYQPRVLLCGGVTSQVIDLGQSNPIWATVPRNGSTASLPRTHASATLLPTGDVLLTGGTTDTNDQAGVFAPELYSTPLDHSTNTYLGGVGHWDTINELSTVLRNYHSSALLMPDGRVWTAGGNSPDQPNVPPTTTQKQIEIFDPPYPAGTRPTISSCPTFVAYGDQFTVGVPNAAQIATVVLMRCGSSTHAYNPDQRAVVLSFQVTSTNTLVATAPPGGAIAPPGYYMLFVVDQQRRPCSYASFVRVGGQLSMFTNRSHFSLHEVEALLSGSSPVPVPNAFYVVLDGFCANDLSSTADRPFPPNAPQFHFTDDNSAVPGLSAEFSNTLYENPAAPPNVTQRITLAYRLRFTSTDAFNGIAAGAERDIRIDVAWGPSQTSGHMFVFQHEHVYALDGPTPWLSIDVRVVRVPRDTMFAGRNNTDPLPFVRNLINDFRGLPNDEFHPFFQLSPDQNASALELSDVVNGVAVDNFAFAKVRFRASSGINASPVKVFFRMFTTAVTNLDYDDSPTGVYPRSGSGANALPQQGMFGGQIASLPFFATSRANLGTDPDTINATNLNGAGSTEVVTYFGCWLDFNHDITLRNQIRGRHQCLVAEIHYPPSPIPFHATPANNDQLSQRNLAIAESDNPGWPASHTIAHTFELKPSDGNFTRTLVSELSFTSQAFAKRQSAPDELFIRWNDLPSDSIATIYLPGADMNELLAYAAMRPGHDSIAAIDDHTVRCRIGDATYLPIPGGRSTNLPGLITIQLPPTVRAGTTYTVSVHQVSGGRGTITGSFDLIIPISDSALLVDAAQRDLSVLREIGATIPPDNRWYPVFQQYLKQLGDQVHGFGGDPNYTPPSQAARFCCYMAWLVAVFLAFFVIALGFAGGIGGRLSSIVFGLIFLFAMFIWQHRCRPSFCTSLPPLLLGLGVAMGIVGLLILGGLATASAPVLLAALAIVITLIVLLGVARTCLPLCGKDED